MAGNGIPLRLLLVPLRGRSVCANGLEVPMAAAHDLILDVVEQDVLAPDVVEAAISEAIAALTAPAKSPQDTSDLQRALRGVETELRNLTTALAAGGDLLTLIAAIREREQRRAQLERQLAEATTARTL